MGAQFRPITQPPSMHASGPHSPPPGLHGLPVITQTPRLGSQASLGQSSSVLQVQKPFTRSSPMTHWRARSMRPPQQTPKMHSSFAPQLAVVVQLPPWRSKTLGVTSGRYL